MPVDRLVTFEDEVRDVRHIIAVMILDEYLGPDELRDRDEAHRSAEQLGLGRIDEPFVGHVGGHRRHVGDDIDEQLAARDAAQPTLVDDLDVKATPLAMVEHLERIAGLGEHVDILGRPVEPGIARQGVGARNEEGDARRRHELENLRIESFGGGRRGDERRLAPQRMHIVHGH